MWVLPGVVAAVPAVVLAAVLVLLRVPVVVAIGASVVLALVVAWWLVWRADRVVTAGLRLRPVTEDDQPRLFNMVDGLCDTHGYRRPALHVIDTEARNALVWGRRAGAANLAISRGWLESIPLLGLEGLLARELAKANAPGLPQLTVVVSVAGVLPGPLRARVASRSSVEHELMLDDFAAVRATRYPPGLAAALASQLEGSPLVAGASTLSAPLWVTPPTESHALGEAAAPLDIRIDALREL